MSSRPMTKLHAEAQAKDADGIDVHFLLFERDGLLCELQIYKDDGTPIAVALECASVEVVVLK